MTKILTTIDSIHGEIKIIIDEDNSKETMDFKWRVFDQEHSTGFSASISSTPILVTEVAAEHFIRMVLSSLVRAFQVKAGDLTIINHMGEHLSDVQFLPPTFQGNEADIIMLTAQQDSLLKLHSIYEACGKLDIALINLAENEGIVDDFLSLVQVRATGIFLAVKQPSQ